MFCSKCGNTIPDGSRFCTSCGATAEPAQQNYFRPADSLVEENETPTPYAEPAAIVTEEAPGCEEPAAEAPEYAWSEPAVDAPEYGYYETEEAPKPSKKKKFVLLGVAAALVFAMFVGMIAFIAIRSTPKAKVLRAAKKSGADLTEVLEGGKHFGKAMDNASSLLKKKEFTLKVDYAMESEYKGWYEKENKVKLQFNYSLKDEKMSGFVTVDNSKEYLEYPEDNRYSDYRIELYADDEIAAVAMPGTLSAAYSVPLEGLGNKLLSSRLGDYLTEDLDEDEKAQIRTLDVNLFADTSWKAFKKAYPNQAEMFMDSLTVEKANFNIPNARTNMKVYSVNWDMWALKEMLVSYQMFVTDARFGQGFSRQIEGYEESLRETYGELAEMTFRVYVGINKGKLVAVYAEIEDDYGDETVALFLDGNKNVWESVRVYEDGEEVFLGGAKETNNGFEIWGDVDGEDFRISCLDSAGELFINVDEENYIVKYGHENKGCQLQFNYSEDDETVSVSVELLPMEKIQKPAPIIDALTLDEDDVENIIEKIDEKLD